MRGKKVYIAGPMRGIPYYNFPAFDRTQAALEAAGYVVLNPAQMDRDSGFNAYDLPVDSDWEETPEGFSFDDCVTRDIAALRECEAVLLLPGWFLSLGAKAEKALAEWLGLEILYSVPGLAEGIAK